MATIIQQPNFLIRNINLVPSVAINCAEKCKQINLYVTGVDEISSLPIFTYPSISILGEGNVDLFNSNSIRAVIPKEINLETRINYSAKGVFSLFTAAELEALILNKGINILNSIAINVTEDSFRAYNIIESIKNLNPKTSILAGPVQNPDLFSKLIPYCNYITVGNSYVESSDLFHVNIITILQECVNRNINHKVGIIVDDPEACNSLNNIMKTLALGADYVMLGEELCSTLEANGPIWKSAGIGSISPVTEEVISKIVYLNDFKTEQVYRSFTNDRNNFVKITCKLEDYIRSFKKKLNMLLSMTYSADLNELHNSKNIIFCNY